MDAKENIANSAMAENIVQIDNVNHTLKENLSATIKRGDKLAIAASRFSIYAYQTLKKELDSISELRFLFTSPAFLPDATPKEKREFYIPRLTRERSLYGTDFEVRLRNELTQKAIARECARWVEKKARFRSNQTPGNITGFMHISGEQNTAYLPINGFTTSDLGCEQGDNLVNTVNKFPSLFAEVYAQQFDQLWQNENLTRDVTDEVIELMSAAYQENAPEFIYFVALYHIFHEFLQDLSEDNLPNEATGFTDSKIWGLLYDFQKDAVRAIINKLETFNGCILADSVGLGKTYTALAVIKYYENRNKNVLVLCPKKLAANWNTYKNNYKNNPIAADRLGYTVLYHTDLSRDKGESNGLDLSRLNWGNYDLVVIDESHNFRNGGDTIGEDERENRYLRLMNQVIKSGVETKVLMLSATPVNNRFTDLRNQLELAYEGRPQLMNARIGGKNKMKNIFTRAQKAFNQWSKLDPSKRTVEALKKNLDLEFFQLLDNVTIARSRKHIEKYYDMTALGSFPERLKPISLSPDLTDLPDAINYEQIFTELERLNLFFYQPLKFVFQSRLSDYIDESKNINGLGREQGIRRLMQINFLKRLESSVESFRLTVTRVKNLLDQTLAEIAAFEAGQSGGVIRAAEIKADAEEFDADDLETDCFDGNAQEVIKIDLNDMDYLSWREELKKDQAILEFLLSEIAVITPEHDGKLKTLFKLIENKITHPINDHNQKILIFSAFADTADYLYKEISQFVQEKFNLDSALITGTQKGQTTFTGHKLDMDEILILFAPKAKDKAVLMPNDPRDISVLIATDCISEGQNLQDCDYCVNYDIHWNPVRLIQRFGRIDRIGSPNAVIQMVNFWPNLALDQYLTLKRRVETKMSMTAVASTDDNNLISADKVELEYREAQLRRLQDEVVDLEDVGSGISIMDLGLNEFRLDLLSYGKNHRDLDRTPLGLHAVVPQKDECPEGVIFVLKNRNDEVNPKQQNQLHPFYLFYVDGEGNPVSDYLAPKALLDRLRSLCRGKDQPVTDLCHAFNQETRDGKDMRQISKLLTAAIEGMLEEKETSDIESLFRPGGTTALTNAISGLDDFELICFLVVR